MSGSGWVTTARGEALNFDDLIAKSKRPIGTREEKTEIKKRKIPGSKTPLNIRGFQPAQGEATPPVVEVKVDQPKEIPAVPLSAYNDGKKAESVSDITGIKVRKRAATKKPKETVSESSNSVLNDITNSLESNASNAAKAADVGDKKVTKRSSAK